MERNTNEEYHYSEVADSCANFILSYMEAFTAFQDVPLQKNFFSENPPKIYKVSIEKAHKNDIEYYRQTLFIHKVLILCLLSIFFIKGFRNSTSSRERLMRRCVQSEVAWNAFLLHSVLYSDLLTL